MGAFLFLLIPLKFLNLLIHNIGEFMKKLNLRGRELEKIGFYQGEQISLIINIIHKNFRRSEKPEVLKLLKDLVKYPAKYRKDPKVGQISNILLSGNKSRTEKKQDIIKRARIRAAPFPCRHSPAGLQHHTGCAVKDILRCPRRHCASSQKLH